jgi:D-inositol-3-phosphate glycosyltransferase
MNVYVRELTTALARSGVRCDVFTRADDPSCPATIAVEPGFRVHHVPAGPLGPVAKEALPDLVDEWADGVRTRLFALAAAGRPVEAIHANYWLSGVAGHRLKHELDIPLVSTFHTLDRVKAELSPEAISAAEPQRRAEAEAEMIGCSDAILASCSVEADQLIELYGAPADRIEIVAPGFDHAFFAPGNKAQARRAIGAVSGGAVSGGAVWGGTLSGGMVSGGAASDVPLVLFVGRIQPLKGLFTAVQAFAGAVASGKGRAADAEMIIVGGPSGPHGAEELARVESYLDACGLRARVRRVPAQPHEMLSTYFRAADVCVVPSRSESFGLVAIEAAACGTPVLASAVGGLTTLVDDGITGYLLDPLDPGPWAQRLAELLDSPERIATIGAAAADRAGAYTWTRAAQVLRRCCDELTARQLVACR